MFPIGSFTKDVVKKIAATSGFENIAQKRESMGICFIGKRKNGFTDFIQVKQVVYRGSSVLLSQQPT